MTLKDRLRNALAATPSDNTTRQQTLREVLTAAGNGSDAEIQAALSKIIRKRERKAVTLGTSGQSELASIERAEVDALRGFVRLNDSERAAAPKKSNRASSTKSRAGAGPLVSRSQMIIGGAVALTLASVGYFALRPSGDSTDATNTGTKGVSVLTDDRTMGRPNAPITMVEYAAPTCPHCANFAMTVMPLIKQQYIDTGKVYYIFRVFPLSAPDGAVEGIARLCLPKDKYFQFMDLMFRNQSKWDPDGNRISDIGAAIKQMARILGVPPEQADRCMTDGNEQQRINQVAQEAINLYNVQGTPTFVINGTIVQAAESTWPAMKARFDSLLSK